MKRYGEVIRLNPDKYAEYKYLHDNIWQNIVDKIKKANIQNFTIFYRDGYLFKYFEYIGNDYESDMRTLSEDSENIEWLKHTDPCQIPVESAKEEEWWAPMEEIFHL